MSSAGHHTDNRAAKVGSAYQRILVTLLQSAPIDFDAECELAQLEADIRADERDRSRRELLEGMRSA